MTYDKVLTIAIKVAETLEKNKSYINELDEKLGDGKLGSKLVEIVNKSIDHVHKVDTKELSELFRAVSKIITKFGGRVGKFYGQVLKEVAEKFSGQQELNLAGLVLIVDFIINKLKHKVKDKNITEHLQFWEEFKKGLAKQKLSNQPLGIILRNTLNDVRWAYPVTRSNSESLVRVLVIRTIVKNI